MKTALIFLIDIYQKIISSVLRQALGVKSACRFSITCSEYAKQSLKEKGVLMGTYLSLIRVLKCQPFYNKTI
jgi:uncharacterized protein